MTITDILGRQRDTDRDFPDGSYNCPFCWAAVMGDFAAAKHVCNDSECPAVGGYYVTAIDGPAVYHMAGPYQTHAEALALVDKALHIANERDGRAWFMSWGTSRRKDGYTLPGALNKYHLL